MAAVAFTAMATTGAHAEEWCGYAAKAKSVVECGYSTVADCQADTGKGGMCFVDPDVALKSKSRTQARPDLFQPTMTAFVLKR